MDDRLLCYVNCTQPASAWGSLRAVVEAQLGTKLTTPADPAETGPFLQMQGGTVVVLDVRAPYPVRELSDDLSQHMAWPGWKNAPRDWRSHFIIAPFGKPTTLAELRDAAGAVLQVAAAIAHATQADAVGWGPTSLFWPARTFVDGVAKTPLNVELLVRCLRSGRQDASSGGVEVTTTGLRTFGLPELHCGHSALRPEAIHNQVMRLASYLMANGPILQDGQTFGSSEAPEAAIEHARDGAGRLVLVVRQDSATSASNPIASAARLPAGVRRPVFGRKGVSPVPGVPVAGLPAPAHLRLVRIDGRDAPDSGKPDRPAFQLIPDIVLMELGPWIGPLLRSVPFLTHVQPLNDIELPGDIAAAVIAEKQALNSLFKPYIDYMRNVLRLVLEESTADTNKQFGIDPLSLSGREQQPGWDSNLLRFSVGT